MPYHVVELLTDGNEHVLERKVIPYPYHSRQEAVETIEGIIGGFDRSGYDAGGGYWWGEILRQREDKICPRANGVRSEA